MTKKDREIYEWFNKIKTKNVSSFIRKFCGKFLDKGLYRDVYLLKRNLSYVVKIQRNMQAGDFSNAIEWHTWTQIEEYKPLSKYLAPSVAIDETGQILIQKRAIFKSIDNYPDKMPSLFSDFKISNYGWISGQIVCVDYAGLLVGHGLKMKKARWWNID